MADSALAHALDVARTYARALALAMGVPPQDGEPAVPRWSEQLHERSLGWGKAAEQVALSLVWLEALG